MSKEQQKESDSPLKVKSSSPVCQMAVTTDSPGRIRKSLPGKATQSASGTMETQTQMAKRDLEEQEL